MGANSKIEWTDHTFNPWIGCAKVHDGCTHCYAEAFAKHTGQAQWGPQGTRVKTSEANWREPLKWNREAERAGVRRRVFCASLADVFEPWQGPIVDHQGVRLAICGRIYVPVAMSSPSAAVSETGLRWATLGHLRRDLFDVIDQTPWLDWLLLTKRPEYVLGMWPSRLGTFDGMKSRCRANVWLGTSVSNQETADRLIPSLLKCCELVPVLFISAEPLLGPITMPMLIDGGEDCDSDDERQELGLPDSMLGDVVEGIGPSRIDWVICGGESGRQARPLHPAWVRSLRDQCQAAGVPFFFKQWGEWLPRETVVFCGGNRDRPLTDEVCYERVGKKAAGRQLDGREWNEFPKVQEV